MTTATPIIFQPNDRVLVPRRYDNESGNVLYEPAVVVSVEVLCDDDDDDDDDGTPTTRHQTRYRYDLVRFGADPDNEENVFRCDQRAASVAVIVPYSDDNLIRYWPTSVPTIIANILRIDWWSSDGGSHETATRRLKIAAEARNSFSFDSVVHHLAGPDALPLHLLGPELLRLGVVPNEIPSVRNWWLLDDDDDDERATTTTPREWARDLDVLFECLQTHTGVPSVATHCRNSNSNTNNRQRRLFGHEEGMTLEHVAAARGDTKLLVWYIEYLCNDNPYARRSQARAAGIELPRDLRGRTPLHHAVLNGHADIIRAYQKAGSLESHNRYITHIEDFDARDDQGQTATDLGNIISEFDDDEATRTEMLTALRELQRTIYQGIVREALVPECADFLGDDYGNHNDTTDYGFLQRIVSEFGLVVGSPADGDQAGLKAVFYAASRGQVAKLHFLLETIDVGGVLAALKDPEDDRFSLLHVAARRGRTLQLYTELRAKRFENEESYCHNYYRYKSDFLADWDGVADIEAYAKNFPFRSTCDCVQANVQVLGEPKLAQQRVAMIQLLIEKGLDLPDFKFLVEECHDTTASTIIQYRLDVDSVIDNWFRDRAPSAMVRVKEYLFSQATVAPSDLALMCVQRCDADPLNECELGRLKLLQGIVKRYGVDPMGIKDSQGDTILHVVTRNAFSLVAAWLGLNYRQLLYTRGADNGKLPVHVALENPDGIVRKHLLSLTSESRSRYGWSDHARIWLLADRDGKTVRDYVLNSGDESLRDEAEGDLTERCFSNLLELLATEEQASGDIVAYCETNPRLLEYIRLESWPGLTERPFRLVHAAICFGRKDFLTWFGDKMYTNECVSFQERLASTQHLKGFPMVPILCHPGENQTVGDLVEVSCTFRTKGEDIVLENGNRVSPLVLDGEWTVEHWLPVGGSPLVFKVYDLQGFSDVAGLEGCEFDILKTGEIVVKFDVGPLCEYWSTTARVVTDSYYYSVCRLEFRRRILQTDGTPSCQFDPSERLLVMTRTGQTVLPRTTWRLAIIVESRESDVKVRYDPREVLGGDYVEWISRASTRFNQGGILKTKRLIVDFYQDTYRLPDDELQSIARSALYVAQRCGQQEIVKWIESETSAVATREEIQELDRSFTTIFLSDSSLEELQSLMDEARGLLDNSTLQDDTKSILEASLYVLDRCWAVQPEPKKLRELQLKFKFDHAGLGMFAIAAALGRLERLRWILDSGRLSMESPCILEAAVEATESDHLEIIQELISRGLNVTGVVPYRSTTSDVTFIRVACECLSVNITRFLLDGGYVPDDHLSTSLLDHWVQGGRVSGLHRTGLSKEKADQHDYILERLCSRGLRPTNTPTSDDGRVRDSTMERFLTMIHNQYSSTRYGGHSDLEDVPLMARTMEILCRYGGDVVTTYDTNIGDRSKCWHREGFPPWLNHYVCTVKVDEQLFSTLLSMENFSVDAAEGLARVAASSHGGDVTTMRDRHGRSLLQLATSSGKAEVVEWLRLRRTSSAGVP